MDTVIITIETLGTLLIAWAAIRVHHRFLNEHRVDQKVFNTMRAEQKLGILGMVLVVISYILNLYF